MLPLLIELGWKSAVIAGVALIADPALRGRPAAERVLVLRVAVLALLALPVAAAALPAIELPWLAALTAPETAAATIPVNAAQAAPVAPAPPASAGIDLVVLAYAVGAGAVMVHLATGIAILTRWTRRSAPVEDARWQAALARATAHVRRPVQLRISRDIVTPISWGLAPAWILIDPATLERVGQADAVAAHEVAHIRRFDWPMLVAARTATALFWFNPLVWMLARTLARRGETAADEAAVRGIERADYAEALLTFATAPATRAAATGMALWPNALAERIAHIAAHRPRRGSRLVPVAAMACVAAAVPLAAAKLVHAVPQGVADLTRDPPSWAGDASARLHAQPRSAAPAEPRRTVEFAAGRAQAASPSAAAIAAVQPPPAETGNVAIVPMPMPMPRPAPQVTIDPQMLRIVGRDGAKVVIGPEGPRVIAGGSEVPAPAPAPAPTPPATSASQTPEWARHAASELIQAAAEMREGARNVELTAELPGVTAGKREEIRRNVKKMRDTADEFENRARALRGPGG